MMLILRFTSRYLIPTCHLISDALRFHDILDPARGKPITITKCFHQSAILYRHWSPENVAEYRMFIFCVFHPSHRPIYRIVCANCEHKWIYSDIRHRQFRTRNMAFHGNYFCIFVRGIKNLPQQHGYYILISCFFGNFFFCWSYFHQFNFVVLESVLTCRLRAVVHRVYVRKFASGALMSCSLSAAVSSHASFNNHTYDRAWDKTNTRKREIKFPFKKIIACQLNMIAYRCCCAGAQPKERLHAIMTVVCV